MELLNDILLESIKGNRDRLSIEDISMYSFNDSNLFISTLFGCIEEIIDNYPNTNNLYDIELMFDYINDLKEKYNDIDLEKLNKKIKKIEKKIVYISNEKLKNKKKAKKELSDFYEELIEFKKTLYGIENLESDFINYLLEKPRNINYIEMVFDKIPDAMKIKDQNGLSLINNLFDKYFLVIDNEDIDNITYYKNLLLYLS